MGWSSADRQLLHVGARWRHWHSPSAGARVCAPPQRMCGCLQLRSASQVTELSQAVSSTAEECWAWSLSDEDPSSSSSSAPTAALGSREDFPTKHKTSQETLTNWDLVASAMSVMTEEVKLNSTFKSKWLQWKSHLIVWIMQRSVKVSADNERVEDGRSPVCPKLSPKGSPSPFSLLPAQQRSEKAHCQRLACLPDAVFCSSLTPVCCDHSRPPQTSSVLSISFPAFTWKVLLQHWHGFLSPAAFGT